VVLEDAAAAFALSLTLCSSFSFSVPHSSRKPLTAAGPVLWAAATDDAL